MSQKLSCQSELMKNHKHAVVMAPDAAFEVIKATTGEALFFSIGTDHVFYVTREVTSATGWDRVDLSSTLSSQHGGSAIKAKSFAITQNSQTHAFDVALVATIAGADYLYLSLGNSGAPHAWSGSITWKPVPFDAAGITPPAPLTIADVYLMQIPRGKSSVENCFVDIICTPGDPLQKLDRYYISLNPSPHWNRHTLAIDLSSGSIQSCLGNRTTDRRVPGIYTFGSISGEKELIFAPQRNAFRAAVPPTAARLTLPGGATAIASALNSSGFTNLFVAAPSGLYLFTPSNQGDMAKPLQVINSSVFSGVSNLSALTNGSRTAVWGINTQRELYYVSCPAGREATPESWSTPVPICKGAENFAFYLNSQAPSNVLFAHLNSGEQTLLQLSQDPVTGCWSQRKILIPATATNDIIEYHSYTTHIQVTDANGVSAPNARVSLSAATHVSVYVNDAYYVLSPAAAVKINADATGVVTVVQETQTLHGACFRVTLDASPSTFVDVNPMSKAFQTLSNIKSASDLRNVKIPGTTNSLFPPSVSTANLNAAAAAFSKLTQLSTTLPSNGSTQTTPTPATTSAVMRQAPSGIEGIFVHMGDFFKSAIEWTEDAWNKVSDFIVHKANEIWHFVVTIAGEVYHGIVNSLAAVAGAFQFILNKLKVAWDDLVSWLGFLFNWGDIVRTHNVMKNIIRLYAQQAVDQISTLETDVQSTFGQLKEVVKGWAGLDDSSPAIGSHTSSRSQLPGCNTPQANWGLHHTKSNVAAASTSHSPPTPSSSVIDILGQFEKMATTEKDEMVEMIKLIKSEIFEKIYTLTPIEVVKKLGGIVAKFLIESVENVVTTVIKLLEDIMSGLIGMLDARIDIPVISPIYKRISGNDLSFLDLACLVGAIPATIIIKLSTGEVPYPDNSATKALINATDFSALSSLIFGREKKLADPPTITSTKVPYQGTTEMIDYPNLSSFGGLADPPTVIHTVKVPYPDNSTTKAMIIDATHFSNLLSFGGESKMMFAAPTIAASKRAAAAPTFTAPKRAAKEIAVKRLTPSTICNAVLNIFAFFGSGVAIFCSAAKWALDTAPEPVSIPRPLKIISMVSYLVIVMPSVVSAPQNSMNNVVTAIAIGKTFADTVIQNKEWKEFSPIVESFINFVWCVPVVVGFVDSEKGAVDCVTLISGILFNVGGILAPGTVVEWFEELAPEIFGATQTLTLIYGVVSLGVAVSELTGQ